MITSGTINQNIGIEAGTLNVPLITPMLQPLVDSLYTVTFGVLVANGVELGLQLEMTVQESVSGSAVVNGNVLGIGPTAQASGGQTNIPQQIWLTATVNVIRPCQIELRAINPNKPAAAGSPVPQEFIYCPAFSSNAGVTVWMVQE